MSLDAGTTGQAMRRALANRCPKCGLGALFSGVLGFRADCTACGLDFSRLNVGDGPTVFSTFIVGALVVGGALWLEFALEPPPWVHVLVWPLVLVGLTLGVVRTLKALLAGAEYRHWLAEQDQHR